MLIDETIFTVAAVHVNAQSGRTRLILRLGLRLCRPEAPSSDEVTAAGLICINYTATLRVLRRAQRFLRQSSVTSH